ncbi:two-component system sensor histidine kinase DesK [Kibdelosporangium banguiense]|uniref:Two-component system sensor histidine kinase DesK n=1 Tax=Kibdelosporangium banguiense TaxID=1365924 RepID=A0ABS4TN58_9PSEU|nr:histidine kinase [Kibdelosporangium banguiense]MBP2325799.1 two-component system sensor histidine kinase DesK [Kibdelosporangium banguiense]
MSTGAVLLSALYMVVLLSLQILWTSRRADQLSPALRYAALFAQACLVYLPLLQFEDSWIGLPGFFAGSVLMVLRPPYGWIAAALVVASMAFTQWLFFPQFEAVLYISLSTTLTGLLVYGLTWLSTLVTELHSAREELAKMAVARERLRFARDLHDLLGYNLSAITLKSELTHRLVIKHPARAREELVEILQISRQALADVRAVASGYREMSLDEECVSARSVLAAADVHVQMAVNYNDLPVRVTTVLATVLREGITNLLRHSKAEFCEISVTQLGGAVTIEIINDGVPNDPVDSRTGGGPGGSGIHNLSARVAELGGELITELQEKNRFRLHAVLPLFDQHPTKSDNDDDLNPPLRVVS